jgi:glycosyltransferase involved in cell wall biosynthesis
VTRWLEAERIDVVQAHLFDASVVGLAAARLAKRPVAVATGHHSHEFPVLPPGPAHAVDRFTHAHLAEHMIVPSRFMRDTVAATYGLPRERIAVVHHGLDPDRLTSSPLARERVRAELGLGDRIVLGAIGRLSWIKQQTALVEAFAAVAAAEPRAVLVIVGTGPARAEVEQLVRARSLEGRVIVTGGRLDVPDVLSAIDLFVHAALTESFGLVLLEAAAAGKPLLSTAVGIAPDLISDGENGLLVPPGDGAALTRALQRLLALRERWPLMGAAARLRSLPFTAPAMVAAYEECYRRWVRPAAGR